MPSPAARHWNLQPNLRYLNHGSFGATPKQVLAAQDRYRAQMEADPVRFFCELVYEHLDRSRTATATLANTDPASIVFCRNATAGVLTALEAAAQGIGLHNPAPLGPNDAILTTTHDYAACRHNLTRIAQRTGAHIITTEIPTYEHPDGGPLTPDALAESILSAVTPNTRVALLSLITSPSALVLPADHLLAELNRRGVAVILDAAHGLGALPIDLGRWEREHNLPFFTTNAHKWLCAPKGAAIFCTREDIRDRVRPIILSNDADKDGPIRGRNKYHHEFDYVGTDDVTPWCAIADAIETLPAIGADPESNLGCPDWPSIIERNRKLALAARETIAAAVAPFMHRDITLPHPDLVGPLAAVPLPPRPDTDTRQSPIYPDPLWHTLIEKHRIQIPAWPTPAGRTLRLSAQLYNDHADYNHLAEALTEELAAEQADTAPRSIR